MVCPIGWLCGISVPPQRAIFWRFVLKRFGRLIAVLPESRS
jgi:hypothetical protein